MNRSTRAVLKILGSLFLIPTGIVLVLLLVFTRAFRFGLPVPVGLAVVICMAMIGFGAYLLYSGLDDCDL